jgi:hypothetical protein
MPPRIFAKAMTERIFYSIIMPTPKSPNTIAPILTPAVLLDAPLPLASTFELPVEELLKPDVVLSAEPKSVAEDVDEDVV